MSRQMLDTYLTELLLAGGSDLHLRVGGQPRIRVNGILETLTGAPVLRDQDTEAMAAAAMRPNLVERFRRGEEVDFAYALPGGHGRFRVNAYFQRDTVALVCRTVATWARTIDDLGLPDIVRRFAEEPRGLVLVAGPTGPARRRRWPPWSTTSTTPARRTS